MCREVSVNRFIYNFTLPSLMVSSDFKNKTHRIIRAGIGAGLMLGLGFLSYAAVSDERQPEIEVRNAAVVSIDSYCCFWGYEGPSRGYRVEVYGNSEPVEFPVYRWDESVREGDSVDLVVKNHFFGGIEGISIDDHK
jgi:hypothetical protein